MNKVSVVMTIILATVLPFAFYVYLGFRRQSQAIDVEDYFVYKRTLNHRDFANTSVGYALQMAAIFLFADWGFRYGFGGFWVPLFWFMGYLLLYFLIPKFEPFLENTWSLHGYLRSYFKSRSLQVVAAAATIVGLWGTMMVEIDYCAAVYQPILGSSWEQGGTFGLSLFFLAFGLSYVVYGGYKATVNNERVQVPIAYAFFLVVIFLLLVMVRNSGYNITFSILSLTLIALFVLMIVAKLNIVSREPKLPEPILYDLQIIIPILGIIATGIIVFFVPTHPTSAVGERFPELSQNLFGQVKAQGALAIISLFFANFFWMPVDVSTWQRISSIQVRAGLSPTERLAPIKKGIFRVMLESPVSWGFGVVFGIALKYSGIFTIKDDPSIAIQKFTEFLLASDADSYIGLIYPIFIVAMIAIMLSTVDELLSAITFTAYEDVVIGDGKIVSDERAKKALNIARATTLTICILGSIMYYSFRFILKIDIMTILYTFYSSQLALFPAVIGSLYRKNAVAKAAIISILSGILAAFVSAYYSKFGGLDLSLFSPLACLGFSSVSYILITKYEVAKGGV